MTSFRFEHSFAVSLRKSSASLAVSLLFALFLSGQSAAAASIDEILAVQYENKMISSGANRPAIGLRRDNRQDILVLLHHGFSAEDIRIHFGWSADELSQRMQLLIENDFVKIDGAGGFQPASMVITRSDALGLAELARKIARPAADALISKIPEIRRAYETLPPFKGIPFEQSSLLILSDVILDNWQINNIERDFLKKERSLRHGLHYYHSLQQKSEEGGKESFGIYGNQMWSQTGLMTGVYGNKRLSSRHLLSLDAEDFVQTFAMEKGLSLSSMRGEVLSALVAYARDKVARLSGDSWVDFLRGECSTSPFSETQMQLLN